MPQIDLLSKRMKSNLLELVVWLLQFLKGWYILLLPKLVISCSSHQLWLLLTDFHGSAPPLVWWMTRPSHSKPCPSLVLFHLRYAWERGWGSNYRGLFFTLLLATAIKRFFFFLTAQLHLPCSGLVQLIFPLKGRVSLFFLPPRMLLESASGTPHVWLSFIIEQPTNLGKCDPYDFVLGTYDESVRPNRARKPYTPFWK